MAYSDPQSEKAKVSARARAKRYYHQNKPKVRVRNQRATRAYRLKKLGITVDQFDAALELQGFCCAICRVASPAGRGRGGWVSDHCHATGRFRGVLCHNCNVSLGLMGEDTQAISRMVAYLEAAHGTPEKAFISPLQEGHDHGEPGQG